MFINTKLFFHSFFVPKRDCTHEQLRTIVNLELSGVKLNKSMGTLLEAYGVKVGGSPRDIIKYNILKKNYVKDSNKITFRLKVLYYDKF